MVSKKWLITCLMVSLLLGLLASGNTAPAPKPPIKIGVLSPLSGPHTTCGVEIREGLKLAFEETGNKIGGREIQIIAEDTEAKPDVALTKARKLVERDRVHLLGGVQNSGEALSVAGYVREQRIPWMITLAGVESLTQSARSPYIFRCSFTTAQYVRPFAEWLAKERHYRKAVLIAFDAVPGYEHIGNFSQAFLTGGGTILQEFYTKLGTTDYAPYLTAINREADLVFCMQGGMDSIHFLKQYQEYGLKNKIPLVGVIALTDEYVISQVGDASLGIVYVNPGGDLQSPRYVKFRNALKPKGVKATNFAELAYEGGLFFVKALQAINGNIEDKEAFLKALRAVKITDSPGGVLSFDEYQNIIRDLNVLEVRKIKGELQSAPIHVIRQSSQFLQYSPEEYMQKKIDFPGMKGKWVGRTSPM